MHFTYAIQKGLHTFMEKPVTVDGPTTRKMLVLGEEAKKKNLKVGVGLMCRHCEAREELFKRIKDGVWATVVSVEYDPNRSSRIALLQYDDGPV